MIVCADLSSYQNQRNATAAASPAVSDRHYIAHATSVMSKKAVCSMKTLAYAGESIPSNVYESIRDTVLLDDASSPARDSLVVPNDHLLVSIDCVGHGDCDLHLGLNHLTGVSNVDSQLATTMTFKKAVTLMKVSLAYNQLLVVSAHLAVMMQSFIHTSSSLYVCVFHVRNAYPRQRRSSRSSICCHFIDKRWIRLQYNW